MAAQHIRFVPRRLIGFQAMGHRDDGELVGICGYAKSKYEEKLEHKRRRRSHSELNVTARTSTGKLHKTPKPPSTRTVSEKPRSRLRKQPTTPQLVNHEPKTDVYVLEYNPDEGTGQPGNVLGVYSTFDSVTLGALKHGAYTFSREGLLDGNEYLSPTGRIKLVRTSVQHAGIRAPVLERSISLDGGHVRLDIPHPASGDNEMDRAIPVIETTSAKNMVFVANRKGPQATSWIGVFADKSLAWGACLKDKAMCAVTMPLTDEVRSIGINNMPEVSGRLAGTGRFTWVVEQHVVDG